MMVMTAKVSLKKILLGLAAAAAVILGIIMLLGDSNDTAATAAPTVAENAGRVTYLNQLGWQVNASPAESGQVKIPEESSEVFDRYQALQKSQGFDLNQHAGHTVMRYVYEVTNYPGATDPVYATLLIHKNQVIGGDLTDTSARGKVMPLKQADSGTPTPSTEPTQPTTAAGAA